MEICYGKSEEIVCTGNKTIDILAIHYGRFNGNQCDLISDKNNKKSCTVNNNNEESIIESGDCDEDSKPNAEITLQNKLKESAEVEYRKQTTTEVNSSDTIDSGKGESHYDEISIRDEESIKTEYNHLKFRASVKTNCGTYNNADIGTYDHAEGVARGVDLNSYTYNHNDSNTYNNSGIQRSADCLNKTRVCFDTRKVVSCVENQFIDIIRVHYGRFPSNDCLDSIIIQQQCNGSANVSIAIKDICQGKNTCRFNNIDAGVLPAGTCTSNTFKPYAEITYDCKGNVTEDIVNQHTDDRSQVLQKLPYILVGVVVCVVIVIVSAVYVRRRLKNKEQAEVEYRKQTSTEVINSDTIDSGKGESHYDEISIRDEESIKTEYNHLKFRASVKTNCGTYNNADIGTYDHAEGVVRGAVDLNSYTYNHNDISTYNTTGIQISADGTEYSNHC
ncbi:unnamed protein product [Mytilus edulis]|uniref:SUEL-type lectin domain-containing protein n=1 Tax=Mytilus edulis TaxID=6550 RepID=A0A8S3S8U7_MYTED|nr:unnamed protein product [Mytilus edulis]